MSKITARNKLKLCPSNQFMIGNQLYSKIMLSQRFTNSQALVVKAQFLLYCIDKAWYGVFSDMMYKMLKATSMSNSEQKCPRACSKQGIMFYGFERSKSREITEVLTYYCGAVQL